MPFARPSILTLIDRAIADAESHLPGADARLRRSNINAFCRVIAGAAHGLYGNLDYLARQILPDTAEDEYVVRHAAIWLPGGRLAATYAGGQVTVNGANGVSIPEDTVYKRPDGARYLTEDEARIAGGVATLNLIAAEAGEAGNTAAGTILRLESPIADMTAQALVIGDGLTGGTEAETIDSLRARLLDRIRQPPMGGTPHDYITWAKEVSFVDRAWCYPLELGDGTVVVRFTRRGTNVIPSPDEVATLQKHIDARRPATAHVFVIPPDPLLITFRIELVPDLTAVRLAVEAELRDFLIREAEPEGDNREGRLWLSRIDEAISLAEGESHHKLITPAADITPARGQMAVYGGTEWE
jgi:uncharacterized phage protein gp47/JayE